jgi:myo-inositol-1(or 4)-monophosphatase
VDPLDGTVNYLSGIPLWCVSIACEDAAGTLAGVVYDPLRDQLFSAVRGGAVRADGGSPRMREHASLAASVITGGVACATDAEVKRAAKLEKRLFRRTGQRRALGTAALELAWTAAGRIDVCYHEQRIHPWDVDAGLFICQRAGLRVHRLAPLAPDLAPRYLAAPAGLAAEVLALVGPSAKERRRHAAEPPRLRPESVAATMRRRAARR